MTGTFKKVSSADGVTTYAYQADADGKTTQEELEAWEGATITLVATKKADGTYDANANAKAMTVEANNSVTFQIGANGVADQRVSLAVGDMSSEGIGVNTISVATQDLANLAIESIDAAINKVSGTRADLGALQNRLEHTVNSLSTTAENLQAAEARIRDCDMAKEMSEMTKNNILTQAAQSMLAQANAAPQGILSLLQ